MYVSNIHAATFNSETSFRVSFTVGTLKGSLLSQLVSMENVLGVCCYFMMYCYFSFQTQLMINGLML